MDERHTQLAGLTTFLISERLPARLRVVFLHGFDMQASDLTPFAHSLAVPGVAYAFPQAPLAVSETGYGWWAGGGRPKATADRAAPRDLWDELPAGREAASERLSEFLGTLQSRYGEPVVLAGFSQGGMLACDSVLMNGTEVCGLAAMSASGIAGTQWLQQQEHLAGLPAFVSHGRDDPDLSFAAGQRLAAFLTSSGASVDWLPFDGGHGIPFQVWKGFRRFLQARVHATAQANAYGGYTGQDARL